MNDFIEALKTRLSSPILGYFGLALLAFNWEGFFYLLVQDGEVLNRIKYFQDHTSIHSLMTLPLFFSFGLAVLHPWALLLVAWVTAMPLELKDMIQAGSEHKMLLRRKRLEEARTSLLASKESELIERAKRDQELDKIENEELKEKLRLELEQLRIARDSIRGSEQPSLPQARHKELMDIAGNYRDRASKTGSSLESEKFLSRARDLEEQAHQIIMRAVGEEHIENA